jgi:hypothetical protein
VSDSYRRWTLVQESKRGSFTYSELSVVLRMLLSCRKTYIEENLSMEIEEFFHLGFVETMRSPDS